MKILICQSFYINTVHTETKNLTDPLLKIYPEVFKRLDLVSGGSTSFHVPKKVPLSIPLKLKTTFEKLGKAGTTSKVKKPASWVTLYDHSC